MKKTEKIEFARLMAKLERKETLTEQEMRDFMKLSARSIGPAVDDVMYHRIPGSYGSRHR
jgi:hypothetical protein